MEISSLLRKTADKYIRANKDKYIAKGKIEGRAEGRAEGEKLGMANAIINNIKSLMETMNLTAEKAMKSLKIPEEEHNFYLTQLNTL